MKTTRIISGLALLTALLVSSCAKMEPLKEKHAKCCDTTEESVEYNAIMIGDNNDSTGDITDPDHDEEHDKDELKDE